jgi:hypothetical protein
VKLAVLLLLAGCHADVRPPLLTGCPRATGAFDYDSSDCPPIVWDHMPLRVAWMGHEGLDVLAAMNVDLGFEAFVPASMRDVDLPDVIVDYEGPRPPSVDFDGGQTLHFLRGGRMTAFVATWRNGGLREVVLAHELGHVLGLAHDRDDPNSLMYPAIKGQPMELREDDRALLRRLYVGR